MSSNLTQALLELADDNLILGHRLSEWCGHAPMLEEDLALPNMGLDLIGTARTLYSYAGTIESNNKSEDDLAFLRDEREFLNCLLVERPNVNFAHTVLKQLYFSTFMKLYWNEALNSKDEIIVGVAGKAKKEMSYHIRHSGEWVIRLGDGTTESNKKLLEAVDALHIYTNELFFDTPNNIYFIKKDILPSRKALKSKWEKEINSIFKMAFVPYPEFEGELSGGRLGLHGEELGHLLASMQSVHRAHPGAKW
ncbi:MAG: phenylacetate-CoA oxygenase subunit PaaI [Rhodobacteraceae bacterium]|jgi:ring-1,2-phenylacetyl-CoA epoxidase subunit PaaC|nr:phenylacetate-CoA oxygenase subunit PaaI [Paracoccaceae bacterium]MDG1939866.1 phenylacetate-CoA oxygenase subunit PaaC [Paracoccaceae bacterium]|tara:strand:+ start:8733 stop:9485 length:753 start_codon:yes stop_codon:yes gene_type:complete